MSQINRRELLHWMGAGAALLSPLYHRLRAEAAGVAPRPVLVTAHTQWGALTSFSGLRSPAGPLGALNPALVAMEPFKDKILFVNQFNSPANIGLHGPGLGFTGRVTGGPSLDQFIAKAQGSRDPFPSLTLATGKKVGGVDFSFDDLGKGVPNADLVGSFSRIFGGGIPAPVGGAGGTPVAAPVNTSAYSKNVLDLAVSDVQRMRLRLAGTERVKLEQYLESLRGVQQQILTLATAQQTLPQPGAAGGGCSKPATPTIAASTAQFDPVYARAVQKATVDLIVSAIACGMTSVATYAGEGPIHNMIHGNNVAHIVDTFASQYEAVAYMFNKMKSIAWGGGTLLDSTLFMHISTQGSHHQNDNVVGALMGGLTSRLGGGGRNVQLPAKTHTVAELYATIANVFNAPLPGGKFGDPQYCPGPLSL